MLFLLYCSQAGRDLGRAECSMPLNHYESDLRDRRNILEKKSTQFMNKFLDFFDSIYFRLICVISPHWALSLFAEQIFSAH